MLFAVSELTSQVKRLQQEHNQQMTRLRALGYQQKMAELQKESVELAKELSELETSANWASGELGKLRGELAALEARDVAQELPVGAEVYARSHSINNITRYLSLYASPLQDSGPTVQTGRIPIHVQRGSSRS
jgi:predicted RNase H-like nuclease (RuvC/YqgF family)